MTDDTCSEGGLEPCSPAPLQATGHARVNSHLLSALALVLLSTPSLAGPRTLATPDAAAAVRLGDGWLSTGANDFNLSTDAAERWLVFGRSSTGDFGDAQVWIVRRDGDDWSEAEPAAFSDPRWRHSDPWLTPDGRWLYFVSSRPAPRPRCGTRGPRPVTRADRRPGRSPLEHLVAASSPGEELGPEVHDGWLVFNSTRAGGPVPMALYRARLVDGVLTDPEPMPAPFNDGRVQGDLIFSPDGRIALFWSVRGERPSRTCSSRGATATAGRQLASPTATSLLVRAAVAQPAVQSLAVIPVAVSRCWRSNALLSTSRHLIAHALH